MCPQECVAVPRAEYQRLLAARAEVAARQAAVAMEGAVPALAAATVRLQPAEHKRLLAAAQVGTCWGNDTVPSGP